MVNEKQYGKLTSNQFRQLIGLLPVMQAQQQEMLFDLAATSEERWTELLKVDYNWGWCYELPFTLHIAISIVALGLGEYLKETASQPDPQQAKQLGSDSNCFGFRWFLAVFKVPNRPLVQ